MKLTLRSLIHSVTVGALALTTMPALGQSLLGHEYELDAAPIREGEQAVIPLDTKDPSYNIWRELRDLSGDPKREPGIINLQKYNFGLSYNAMPTFFHMPVAMSPADLKASKVDIAILGAVTDMGTGMRGAAHGPNAVRNSNVYGGYGARQPHLHTMVDPFQLARPDGDTSVGADGHPLIQIGMLGDAGIFGHEKERPPHAAVFCGEVFL